MISSEEWTMEDEILANPLFTEHKMITSDDEAVSVINPETEMDNYRKYRGKCKEMSEELCAADPTLRLVRGYYHCPHWGKQAHWWCSRPDGIIVDPTVLQFPSKGYGVYEEFDGICECEYCGKLVGRHFYCSYECYGKDVWDENCS